MATNTPPIAVIARLLDLTERRVQQLGREGVIPKAERGRYDLVGAVRGYVRYLRVQAARVQGGAADFGAERARLVRAKADLAEMDAACRRGELLAASDVEEAWIAVLARLRARLLALPDRMAPLVHQETTIAGVRAQIRQAVGEALSELATLPVIAAPCERAAEAGADDDEGAGDPGAAAGGDDCPVG
jgi:phage terminase Nu1 subunit (DNA packaging protein)